MVTSKPVRTLAAVALSVGLALGATACSTPQTLQPYTPAEGVNAQLGKDNQVPLKVRNLMILSKTKGQGFLAGAILSPSDDALTNVSGQVFDLDGNPGGSLGPTQAMIKLPPNTMVNLLDQPAIRLDSPDLVAGEDAELVLTFQNAGPLSLKVPVVDGTKADYRTVTPMPAPGGSSASPNGSASPAPTAAPGSPAPTSAPASPSPTPTR